MFFTGKRIQPRDLLRQEREWSHRLLLKTDPKIEFLGLKNILYFYIIKKGVCFWRAIGWRFVFKWETRKENVTRI